MSNKCYKLKNIEELNEIKDADSYIFIGLLSFALILCCVWVFLLQEYSMSLKHLLFISSYFIIAGILLFILFLYLGIKKNKMLNEKYKDAYLKDNKKSVGYYYTYIILPIIILLAGFSIAKDFIFYSELQEQKYEKVLFVPAN